MEKSTEKATRLRHTRALRVRKHLRGSESKPRMCVVKTNKHIHVQVINDEIGKTLCSASTCSGELKGSAFAKKNKASAKHLGEMIAEKAKAQGIKSVVFDRGPFKYHGILAAVADAAREHGLQL